LAAPSNTHGAHGREFALPKENLRIEIDEILPGRMLKLGFQVDV